VLNADAGSVDPATVDAVLDALRGGAQVEPVRTASPEELDAALAGRGDRRIVVLGGDGSLHAVLGALHRSGWLEPADPIGIVPFGTGNDFARTLGMPLDPVAAAGVVLTGVPERLDVLVERGGPRGAVVVNAAHVGIGAEAASAAADFKEALGAAAYPLGAAIAGATATGWGLRVEVDGAVLADGHERLLMVGVCNGRTIGGGAPLAPQASVTDGLADVVVCRAVGPLARVGFATALREGEHLAREDVELVRGRNVTVSGGPFPLNADGEVTDGVTSRTWTVRPGAWSALVPG
jgi:diacylglycerol kinase family enzyme